MRGTTLPSPAIGRSQFSLACAAPVSVYNEIFFLRQERKIEKKISEEECSICTERGKGDLLCG